MLHTETVEEGTLALIKTLSEDKDLQGFILVGGTALGLQTGHRKSIDIDLFNSRKFNFEKLLRSLEKKYDFEYLRITGNGIVGVINGVKLDILFHRQNWINPPQHIDNIRMSSLLDIGAMKVNAIVSDGSRLKDFVDMHVLLEHHTMQEILKAYTEKYPGVSRPFARQALIYHADINFDIKVNLVNRKFNWSQIARRLKEAVLNPDKLFPAIQQSIRRIRRQ